MKVVVNIPADLELQHRTYNIRTAPEMTEAGGSKIYTWSFTNLKPRSLEGHQPSGSLFEPRIVFGTSRNLYSILDDFTDQKAFDYRTNDEMNLFVTNTVNEKDKELSGLVALQSAVVDQFNYYGINPRYTGFKSRTAEKTWASNGGTKIEKAVLLTALLRHAGYEAIPVGVIPDRLFDRDASNMMSFSDILVQVSTKNNGLIYLSPVSHQKNDYKYHLADQTVVVIDPNIESLKTYEPESRKNGLAVEGSFEIDEEQNMKGIMEAKFMEGINPYFQLIDNQKKIKDLMRPGFTSKNITSFEMQETTEALTKVEYQVENSNIFKTQENYMMWQFPQSSQGFGSFKISQLSEKREASLAIDLPLKESYHYSLIIPEGMVLVTPEVKIEAKNSIGLAKIEVEAKGNEIKLIRSIEFNKSVIKPVDYKDFKELVDVWLNSRYTSIVFKNID
jgi:hypothetical protein